jgi:hypothetical protein
MSFWKWTLCAAAVALALAPEAGHAKVLRAEKTAESAYGTFKSGAYQRLEYRIVGDLSGDVSRIPELAKAEKNADGTIPYATGITLLVPQKPEDGNGTLLIDVPNRGRTLASGLFNSPRSPILSIGTFDVGNGFLQDNGFSVAVVPWELGYGVELPQIKGEDGRTRYVEAAALAIIRDVAEFLQSESQGSPLGGSVKRTLGIGYSQTGRLLKSFVSRGFNEANARQVFSGVYVFGAGSGLINLRTLEGPESGAGQTPTFANPDFRGVTEAPFSIAEVAKAAGADRGSGPKLMFVNTTTDYYSLRASLGRTGSEGIIDARVPDNVRIYDIAGASHALNPNKSECKHAHAVLDWHPVLRATLLHLNAWVARDEAPPPNVLMPLRTADGEPSVLRAPAHLPRATIQVPIADSDGIAKGGIRLPDVVAPLGTHAAQNPPFSFVCALAAAYIPFAANEQERATKEDSRPSLRERYPSAAAYKARIKEASEALVAKRFLLPADAAAIIAAADAVTIP